YANARCPGGAVVGRAAEQDHRAIGGSAAAVIVELGPCHVHVVLIGAVGKVAVVGGLRRKVIERSSEVEHDEVAIVIAGNGGVAVYSLGRAHGELRPA